ncbi:MAG: lytic transglycosylase domain-containing protein [Rhizobiales bacterium]|nr:lytic transglycosylase domain-containing protein [Hyphomicrobiales bacterium]
MSLVTALSANPQIAAALQQASQRTGTDFDYLLKTAMRESSLNCTAKSGTSSACGLFQFTEQSWLGTMKRNGDDLGLGQYASQITQDGKGRYRVADPAARQEILALRNDPTASALMAGAYTSESESTLSRRLDRDVSEGELYIAHFLGAGGAVKLISAAEDMPHARADTLFPQAAAANKSIFYDGDRARSVSEVYQNLVAKHEGQKVNVDLSQIASAAPNNNAQGDALAAMFDDSWSSIGTAYNSARSTLSAVPSGGASIAASNAALSRPAMVMSPAIVQILATLDPLTPSRSEDASASRKQEEEDRKRQMDLTLTAG